MEIYVLLGINVLRFSFDILIEKYVKVLKILVRGFFYFCKYIICKFWVIRYIFVGLKVNWDLGRLGVFDVIGFLFLKGILSIWKMLGFYYF